MAAAAGDAAADPASALAPAATKTLLTVMYAEKDTVKALGATWDASSKEWFALPGVPLEPLRRYIDRKRIYLNVPFAEKEDSRRPRARSTSCRRRDGTSRSTCHRWDPSLQVASSDGAHRAQQP